MWGDEPHKQPYATKTPFGWCVAGPVRNNDTEKLIALSIFKFDACQEVPGVSKLERHAGLDVLKDLKESVDCAYQKSHAVESDVTQELSNYNLEKQIEKFWTLEQHGFTAEEGETSARRGLKGVRNSE